MRSDRIDTDPTIVSLRGAIRRMVIKVTARALWQLLGHRMPGGNETMTAEAFTGIGFYSRPATTGSPEAIVLNVGDANAPVIVATRDERTRASIAGNVQPDETALFNSKAIVIAKADGTIEARSKSGAAVELATKDDLQKLRAALSTAVIALGANGALAVVTAMDTANGGPNTWPKGTKKFKGE